MTVEVSSRLLRWFTDYFSDQEAAQENSALGCIVYEMFGLNDAFGRVMLNNLQVSELNRIDPGRDEES